MRAYIVKCPNCRHTIFRGKFIYDSKLMPENGGKPIMPCGWCGQAFLNTWASNEPAFLTYEEYEHQASRGLFAIKNDLELHQRWKESDNRLRDLDYSLSLLLAGYPVPMRYFPEGFKLITDAEKDEGSPYAILGAYACDRTESLESRRDQRVRELHPNQTGFDSKKTKEELTKVMEAYRFLSDPEKRKLYDCNYMHLSADRDYKIVIPMLVERSMPIQ